MNYFWGKGRCNKQTVLCVMCCFFHFPGTHFFPQRDKYREKRLVTIVNALLVLFDSTYPLADVIMLIPSTVLETHGMHLMCGKSFVCFFESFRGTENV